MIFGDSLQDTQKELGIKPEKIIESLFWCEDTRPANSNHRGHDNTEGKRESPKSEQDNDKNEDI